VYPPLGSGTFSTGTLTDLQLSTAPNPPLATTSIGAGINLPANAKAPATATFSPTDSTSYNQTTSVTVYDSLGAAHSASLYFVAGATAGN
ncbi:flagellar basal body FlgE domain-containing protein, partial [Escherichia coli]|uniref:flagellar basal body FlgE domain-containing protein n=1 Tax=Escherichia coli TaxID=562 RepID=UPI00289D7212